MLTPNHRTYSLPNLADMPRRLPAHNYTDDMIARINDVRPVVVSVSMDNIAETELTEKPFKIRNNLQAYTLLEYKFCDVSAIKEDIPNFYQLHESEKNKHFIVTLRRINKELKEILSACTISLTDNLYCFHNKDWPINPITLNLYDGMSCDYKIFCHLLLHGIHFGYITSIEDMDIFYESYCEKNKH